MNRTTDSASGRHRLQSASSARRRRRLGALLLGPAVPAVVGLSVLVSACGDSHENHVARLRAATVAPSIVSRGDSARSSSESAHQHAALAFSRCMRARGVPNFPDPDSEGGFPSLTQETLGVSKQTSLRAQQACQHLLSRGGTRATPQQAQLKLAHALKLAQCIRKRGFPALPDPTGSSQSLPQGIDPNSPQFQAAEAACNEALGAR